MPIAMLLSDDNDNDNNGSKSQIKKTIQSSQSSFSKLHRMVDTEKLCLRCTMGQAVEIDILEVRKSKQIFNICLL